MRSACEVGSGEPGDVSPCGEHAPYVVSRWGFGRSSEELRCCPDHAYSAITDGALVEGPGGHECRLDDDGEIYEVSW